MSCLAHTVPSLLIPVARLCFDSYKIDYTQKSLDRTHSELWTTLELSDSLTPFLEDKAFARRYPVRRPSSSARITASTEIQQLISAVGATSNRPTWAKSVASYSHSPIALWAGLLTTWSARSTIAPVLAVVTNRLSQSWSGGHLPPASILTNMTALCPSSNSLTQIVAESMIAEAENEYSTGIQNCRTI